MLRNIISEREKELPLSTIGKLIEIAEEWSDIISLGPGEPDFDSPPQVIEAAKRALDKGFTHYSPVEGREDLRREIVKKLRRENRIGVGPGQVVVTSGSTEGILLTLMCTVDPGQGVIIPDPGFLGYKPAVEILNGMPLSIPLEMEDDFSYDVDLMFKRFVPEKTKVLILNTPCNPTGTVLTKKNLEEIADFATEYDLLILSDEAYESFVYEGARHISIGSLNGMAERTVTLQSFSKTFAMPGFRLGYACGPEKIISAMRKVHVFTTICAPTVSQVAALAALRGGKAHGRKMVREYDRRRKFVVKRLENMGLAFAKPLGAFYVFPNIEKTGMGSLAFAEKLLKKEKVAVVPGTEFGRNGEGFVRISYATAFEKVKEGMERMERFLRLTGK